MMANIKQFVTEASDIRAGERGVVKAAVQKEILK